MKGEALIRLVSGELRRAELHWYEAHGVGKRNMKFKRYLEWAHERTEEAFPSVCTLHHQQGQRASLERNKIYVLLPDRQAEVDGLVRVIDEDGEDYLYPAEWFVAVDVPKAVRASLLKASWDGTRARRRRERSRSAVRQALVAIP
jgi:hypothetical protein